MRDRSRIRRFLPKLPGGGGALWQPGPANMFWQAVTAESAGSLRPFRNPLRLTCSAMAPGPFPSVWRIVLLRDPPECEEPVLTAGMDVRRALMLSCVRRTYAARFGSDLRVALRDVQGRIASSRQPPAAPARLLRWGLLSIVAEQG